MDEYGEELAQPRARLTYTGQPGPTGSYTVAGFQGCAPPGAELVCYFSDRSKEVMATVNDDGSFEFTIAHERGREGFTVRARNENNQLSLGMHPRLDYPMMAHGPFPPGSGRLKKVRGGDRGWVVIAPVSAADSLDQLSNPDAYFGRLTLDSLEPEDFRVYGYAAEGDTATCIVVATGKSFSSPIGADGTYSIDLPKEEIRVCGHDGASFVINVSDNENRLLAAMGINPGGPDWARE